MYSLFHFLLRSKPGGLPKWPFLVGHCILVLAALTVLLMHRPLDGASILVCCFAVMAAVGVLLIPYYCESRQTARKARLLRSPLEQTGRCKQAESNSRQPSSPCSAAEPVGQTADRGYRPEEPRQTLIQPTLPLSGIGKMDGEPVAQSRASLPAQEESQAGRLESPAKTAPNQGTLLGRAFATAQTTAQTRAVNRLIETGFSKAAQAGKEKEGKNPAATEQKITTSGR